MLEQGHWKRRKDIMYYSKVSSPSLKFIFKGVCRPVSHLMHKKPCVAVFILNTLSHTVDTAADFPPGHIRVGVSTGTILCCNSVRPLAVSISLPVGAEISHKLFSFCPSLIPGSPRCAVEPQCPSTASGRKSKCLWARGKHFWLLQNPCCFMPCMKEFAACSNSSKQLSNKCLYSNIKHFF